MAQHQEEVWVSEILKPRIREWFTDYIVETKMPLCYSVQIDGLQSYIEDDKNKYSFNYNSKDCKRGQGCFETDIAICKKVSEKLVPMIVIEVKLGGITTHDLITYREKMKLHKSLFPFMSYGIVIAKNKKSGITRQKLFQHGKDFDFIFRLNGNDDDDVDEAEMAVLKELIRRKLDYSNEIYEMINSPKIHKDFKYYEKIIKFES